jgi:hypothetical protein
MASSPAVTLSNPFKYLLRISRALGSISLEVLQALCLCQNLEDLLLHLIDVLWSVTLSSHQTCDLYFKRVESAKITVGVPCAIAHGQEAMHS